MNEKKVFSQFLSIGVGSIGPQEQLTQNDYELIKAAEHDLLYDETLYTTVPLNLPVQCVDERTVNTLGCSALGGSFSLVLMDAFGPRLHYLHGENAVEHARRIYKELENKGLPLGGHDDDHAHSPNSGCGGQDRFGMPNDDGISVLSFMSERFVQIHEFVNRLHDSRTGLNLDINANNNKHSQVHRNIKQLQALSSTTKPYITSGEELRNVMAEVGGEHVIDRLHGLHDANFALLDFRQPIDGKIQVLQRELFRERYGNKFGAFYVCVNGLQYASKIMYSGYKDQQEMADVAGLYSNLAGLATLSNKNLRLLTLSDNA